MVAPGLVGGVETVVSELLSAAHQGHFEMSCFALLPDGEPLPTALHELASQGIPVVRIPAPHRAYRTQYRALLQALRGSGVRLIHSHGYHADVLVRFAARALGVPQVATLHGFVGSTRRGQVYEWLQLRALRRAHVIAVSEPIAARSRASGIRPERVHVIPNAAPEASGVTRREAREALSLPQDAAVVGWVGRMSGEKEPEAFVRLVADLRSAPLPIGAMLGDGPCMSAVRDEKARLALGDRVLLPGVVAGAGRLVTAFDALVVTSSTEGTPMVILEAMRAGVPVVSTAVGGVPAVLAEGAGVLVPYGNAEALAKAVMRVLTDQEHSRALVSRAAREVETRFGRDAWWSRHEALYGELLAGA